MHNAVSSVFCQHKHGNKLHHPFPSQSFVPEDFTPEDRPFGGGNFRLKEVLREACAAVSAKILEVEVMPDHVHVLVPVDPQFGITRLVRSMKGRSSRILREEFPDLRRRMRTLWTNSCYVGTVGGASLETVRAYVENQRVA